VTGVVFQVRERSRGNVTFSMMLWATAMAAVLFLFESRLADRADTAWAGVGVTALFGVYLGWRRRAAAVFIAPFVSWLFAWFPPVSYTHLDVYKRQEYGRRPLL